MKKILQYLNPIQRLGIRRYSIIFPLVITLFACVLTEMYGYYVAQDPDAVGLVAIALFIALIIYFAFHDGVRGGFITTTITISYYFYIVYTRHHTGSQLTTSLETIAFLGILYFIMAGIIGWLRQTIDGLIEREANEKKRLQTIIEQLPVGVIITDNKGTIVKANKKIDTILGTKIPIGFRIGKVVHPSHTPLAKVLTTGKPIVNEEYSIKRDGKTIFLDVSAAPIFNNHGKVIAAASIINDITQQKEMETRKDDFVNMASHELKTPITSMKLYIDSLINRMKNYNDEKTTKTLTSVRNQTNKLQKLVSDLLDVSRLQTGKLSLSKEKFEMGDLVEETVEVLGETSKKNPINVIKKNTLIIVADRFRIYQVITNLLTNAIKYSPEGKEIVIRIYKENNNAVVSVKDSGIGIEKNQQKKIFERLYQVPENKEKTFPGFGLGLYISREIIKRHRGKVWVKSEKGKGSTFYFSLPLNTHS